MFLPSQTQSFRNEDGDQATVHIKPLPPVVKGGQGRPNYNPSPLPTPPLAAIPHSPAAKKDDADISWAMFCFMLVGFFCGASVMWLVMHLVPGL